MATKPRLALLSTLLASLVFAGAADAHQLKVPRAAKANKTFAKLLCSETSDPQEKCVSSESGACSRVSAHRVRCDVFITLEVEDGSQGRCQALIEWTIRKGSGALRPNFLGIRSCKQVKPPTPVPAPAP